MKNKMRNIALIMILSAILSFFYISIRNDVSIIPIITVFFEFSLVIYLVFNIKNVFREKKIARLINLLLPVCMLVLQFFWSNQSIYFFFLIYVYISINSIVLSYIIKKDVSFLFSISIYINIILAFILGLFNCLIIYKYLFIIIFIFCLVFIMLKIKRNNIDINNFLDNKIVAALSCLFLFCILGSFNRYVHVYDEYSLWAYDIKYILKYNSFGYSPYAPILTLWQYIVSMYNGFHDYNCYFALSFFINVNLVVILNCIGEKNKKLFIPFSLVLLNSFYLIGGVYNFKTLYADLAFAAIFINIFVFSKLFKSNGLKDNICFYIMLLILTLVKPQGIILSLILLFYHYLSDLFTKIDNRKEIFKNIFTVLKKYIRPVLFVLLVFILWTLYNKLLFKPATDYYQYEVLSDSLRSNISLKLNVSFIAKFILSILGSFDSVIFAGLFKITWIQFILIYFVSLYLVLCLINKTVKKALCEFLPYFITYIVFILLTLLSQFIQFSVYEASILASFGRYINVLNYSYIVIFLLIIIKKSFTNQYLKLTLTIYFILLLIIPFTGITYFISDYKDRINSNEIKYEMEDTFKLVNEVTDSNDKIYILDQKDQDGIMALWYARYYLFPRYTNISSIVWKIKTPLNEDDLTNWGLTYNKLLVHLKEYKFDYIFLYTTDNYLNENLCKNMSLDNCKNELGNNTLLKIKYNDDNIDFSVVNSKDVKS